MGPVVPNEYPWRFLCLESGIGTGSFLDIPLSSGVTQGRTAQQQRGDAIKEQEDVNAHTASLRAQVGQDAATFSNTAPGVSASTALPGVSASTALLGVSASTAPGGAGSTAPQACASQQDRPPSTDQSADIQAVDLGQPDIASRHFIIPEVRTFQELLFEETRVQRNEPQPLAQPAQGAASAQGLPQLGSLDVARCEVVECIVSYQDAPATETSIPGAMAAQDPAVLGAVAAQPPAVLGAVAAQRPAVPGAVAAQERGGPKTVWITGEVPEEKLEEFTKQADRWEQFYGAEVIRIGKGRTYLVQISGKFTEEDKYAHARYAIQWLKLEFNFEVLFGSRCSVSSLNLVLWSPDASAFQDMHARVHDAPEQLCVPLGGARCPVVECRPIHSRATAVQLRMSAGSWQLARSLEAVGNDLVDVLRAHGGMPLSSSIASITTIDPELSGTWFGSAAAKTAALDSPAPAQSGDPETFRLAIARSEENSAQLEEETATPPLFSAAGKTKKALRDEYIDWFVSELKDKGAYRFNSSKETLEQHLEKRQACFDKLCGPGWQVTAKLDETKRVRWTYSMPEALSREKPPRSLEDVARVLANTQDIWAKDRPATATADAVMTEAGGMGPDKDISVSESEAAPLPEMPAVSALSSILLGSLQDTVDTVAKVFGAESLVSESYESHIEAYTRSLQGAKANVLIFGQSGNGKSYLSNILGMLSEVDADTYGDLAKRYRGERPDKNGEVKKGYQPEAKREVKEMLRQRGVPDKDADKKGVRADDWLKTYLVGGDVDMMPSSWVYDSAMQRKAAEEEERSRFAPLRDYCKNEARFMIDGDLPPFLLPTNIGQGVMTTMFLSINEGQRYHALVGYFTKAELQAQAFEHIMDLKDAIEKGRCIQEEEMETFKFKWARHNAIVGTDFEDFDEDEILGVDLGTLPRRKEHVVLCADIAEVAGKFLIKDTPGKYIDIDRMYLREQLQSLLDERDERKRRLRFAVSMIQVFAPWRVLEGGKRLLDAPGTNDVDPFNVAQTERALRSADVIFLLVKQNLSQEAKANKEPLLRSSASDRILRGECQLAVLQCNESDQQKRGMADFTAFSDLPQKGQSGKSQYDAIVRSKEEYNEKESRKIIRDILRAANKDIGKGSKLSDEELKSLIESVPIGNIYPTTFASLRMDRRWACSRPDVNAEVIETVLKRTRIPWLLGLIERTNLQAICDSVQKFEQEELADLERNIKAKEKALMQEGEEVLRGDQLREMAKKYHFPGNHQSESLKLHIQGVRDFAAQPLGSMRKELVEAVESECTEIRTNSLEQAKKGASDKWAAKKSKTNIRNLKKYLTLSRKGPELSKVAFVELPTKQNTFSKFLGKVRDILDTYTDDMKKFLVETCEDIAKLQTTGWDVAEHPLFQKEKEEYEQALNIAFKNDSDKFFSFVGLVISGPSLYRLMADAKEESVVDNVLDRCATLRTANSLDDIHEFIGQQLDDVLDGAVDRFKFKLIDLVLGALKKFTQRALKKGKGNNQSLEQRYKSFWWKLGASHTKVDSAEAVAGKEGEAVPLPALPELKLQINGVRAQMRDVVARLQAEMTHANRLGDNLINLLDWMLLLRKVILAEPVSEDLGHERLPQESRWRTDNLLAAPDAMRHPTGHLAYPDVGLLANPAPTGGRAALCSALEPFGWAPNAHAATLTATFASMLLHRGSMADLPPMQVESVYKMVVDNLACKLRTEVLHCIAEQQALQYFRRNFEEAKDSESPVQMLEILSFATCFRRNVLLFIPGQRKPVLFQGAKGNRYHVLAVVKLDDGTTRFTQVLPAQAERPPSGKSAGRGRATHKKRKEPETASVELSKEAEAERPAIAQKLGEAVMAPKLHKPVMKRKPEEVSGEAGKRAKTEDSENTHPVVPITSEPAIVMRPTWYEETCTVGSALMQTVSRDGGRLQLGGVTLDIPPGALSEDTAIRMSLHPLELDTSGLADATSPCGPIVCLEPHNLSLARPATLTVPRTEGELDCIGFLVRKPGHPQTDRVGRWEVAAAECADTEQYSSISVHDFCWWCRGTIFRFCVYHPERIPVGAGGVGGQIAFRVRIGRDNAVFPNEAGYVRTGPLRLSMPYGRRFYLTLQSQTIKCVEPTPSTRMQIPTMMEWLGLGGLLHCPPDLIFLPDVLRIGQSLRRGETNKSGFVKMKQTDHITVPWRQAYWCGVIDDVNCAIHLDFQDDFFGGPGGGGPGGGGGGGRVVVGRVAVGQVLVGQVVVGRVAVGRVAGGEGGHGSSAPSVRDFLQRTARELLLDESTSEAREKLGEAVVDAALGGGLQAEIGKFVLKGVGQGVGGLPGVARALLPE
ncbi:hypothetical protein CYMTET_25093 [Cymbomonas tetramitiformis]|uniref:ZU5 domain-containing protein n=1 Tax=Cymbomonas tetramitiformis TaxID=36881 RepID=A0AAE0KZK6_9CHLO|nr:hypothetical protein CYMTET_25093 [Cymbomonas tetramitiformis]